MEGFDSIICIVPRNSGELLTHAAKDAGCSGGTIIMGRGTASNSILQMLGFGDASKDIVLIITAHHKTQIIKNALIQASSEKKQPFGILFSIDVTHFLKATQLIVGENKMEENTTHKLITVIVNKGYADDAMDAARKAGASGGTIINARGTAKEGDEKFFGMEIVPEKDLIMIVADNNKADSILEAMKNLPCLQKPGSGIAFASPVADFTVLGKKNK